MSVQPRRLFGRRAIAALASTAVLASGIAVATPAAMAQQADTAATATEATSITATGLNRGKAAVATVEAPAGTFAPNATVTVTVDGAAAKFYANGANADSAVADAQGGLKAIVVAPSGENTDDKTVPVVFNDGTADKSVDVLFVGGRPARQSVLFGRVDNPAIEFTSLGSPVAATFTNLEPGAVVTAVGVDDANWLPAGTTYAANDDGSLLIPSIEIPNDPSLLGKGIKATYTLLDGTTAELVARRNGVTPATELSNETAIRVAAETKTAPGLYQSAYSAKENALFVTRAPFNLDEVSQILKLNPETLEVISTFGPAVGADGKTPREDRVFGIAVDDKRGLVWAGRTLGGSVSVYDAATGELKKAFPNEMEGMSHPRDIIVDEETGLVYVGDVTSRNKGPSANNIRIFDGNDLTYKGAITLPNFETGPLELKFDKANKIIYTVDFKGKTAAKVELNAGNKVTTYDLGNPEVQGDRGAGVALDTKRNRLYVGTQAPSWVKVIDLNTGSVIKTITTGASPLDVLYDETNDVVFAINRLGATVNLIDPDSMEVTATRKIDYLPNQLSTDGKGNVYVTTKVSRDLGETDTLYRLTAGNAEVPGSTPGSTKPGSTAPGSTHGSTGNKAFGIVAVLAAIAAILGGLFHAVQTGLLANLNLNLPKL